MEVEHSGVLLLASFAPDLEAQGLPPSVDLVTAEATFFAGTTRSECGLRWDAEAGASTSFRVAALGESGSRSPWSEPVEFDVPIVGSCRSAIAFQDRPTVLALCLCTVLALRRRTDRPR